MTSGRTITARVARASALTAALAAVLTATLAGGLTRRWVVDREDARLRAAALTLVAELDPNPTDTAARAATAEENGEVAVEGIRLSLWRGDRLLGGASSLTGPERATCESVSLAGGRARRCVVPSGDLRVVALRSLDATDAATRAGALASLLAAAVTAALALVVSRWLAARSLAPLARLAASVGDTDADAPDAARLPARAGYAEVDALRDALAELLARHGRALATTRRFAADAAHELRTPLGTMRAELDLLAESLPTDAAASLGRVRETAVALGSLCERLLVLASPLDAARMAREAVAPADVVREVVAGLPAAQRERVAVALDDDAVVAGDAALLRSVVANAVTNALTFAPQGRVTVQVAVHGEQVVTTVRDEGPGVAAAERERVFEAFYRAPTTRAAGTRGHGVGLALIAHIARAHGGSARFEDVPRGASLRVDLPRWRG